MWLIDGASAGRLGGVMTAALSGWWFGFGYFVAGLYWMGFAFLVDAKTFAWLLPFAVVGLPAALAFFMAAAFGVARLIWMRGPLRILSLALALTVAEWLRGHVLTGFPVEHDRLFAHRSAGAGAGLRADRAVGTDVLCGLAVCKSRGPCRRARRYAAPVADGADPASRCSRSLRPTVPCASRSPRPNTLPGVKLRIMQPNLAQDDKFNYGARQQVMARYLALSDRSTGPGASGVRDVTHLIWPESAFPFFLQREPEALRQIADLLPPGTVLIVGAARPASAAPTPGMVRAYNSIYVIDHDGATLSVYDKLHLVPFGEYLPFQDFLERLGLMQLTKVKGGYIPGTERKPIPIPRAPAFLPLICYEIVFPGEAVPSGERPAWLVNLTNDGWFGQSSGPYQHLQQARVRAIEEGLPLVRAANTGVSAVIDPAWPARPRACRSGTEGVLDAAVATTGCTNTLRALSRWSCRSCDARRARPRPVAAAPEGLAAICRVAGHLPAQ